MSVEPGRKLREEAVLEHADGVRSRPWYAVVAEWREWYRGYLNSHIEFEDGNGETARTALENSYMPEYGKRYYAKLKDLERGIERRYESLTTAMLTFSASTRNANGGPRAPADHMREIAEGWGTARKQLHQVLSGRNWEYAKVWEPTSGGTRGTGGYGHLHVAVFVEDPSGEISAGEFDPVMRSYVENTDPAGWKAHRPGGDAVSVNDDVQNLGSYISEYIGIFGDETLNRPITEQMFYAVTWATNTRRVDFSNGAQQIIAGEKFRRETGLRPSDRGEARSRQDGAEADESDGGREVVVDPEAEEVRIEEPESDESGGWSVESIVQVRGDSPEYHDPTTGGVETMAIDGAPGTDPPANQGGPPPR